MLANAKAPASHRLSAVASRVFWIMLAFSGICIVFCLGVSIQGGDNLRPEGDFLYHPKTGEPLSGPAPDLGHMNLLFGAMRVPLFRDREAGVHLIGVILASWVAGAAGLLLSLVWTAGFVPERRVSCPMDGAYLPQQVQRARAEGRMLGQVRDLIIMRKPRELRSL